MPAPEIIRQLVARFEENRDAYRLGRYNETQLRLEFLNPFFEALGWDLYNKKGYAPDYREVVHEDSIDIEGGSKAPDYSFKIGKERKFFVEAKKPAVNIEYDIHPAYQLRRYAWNVHLPLSILTDFEEFAVYDCRDRPNHDDKASTGRTMFLTYKDYVQKWDEIACIFSPEAIQKGSFEKYAIENKGKKGTTEVDDAFLEDIENWRKLLALNIALRNPLVADDRELNFAVQMTIDRIIFLRICEDRGIEPEEQLLTASMQPGIYTELMRLFQNADRKYNSGLFHFKAEAKGDNGVDTITPSLTIDDKTLKEIIKSIYFPCPYIFKEIPVEILGQVYEQFLGRVIRLTAGHQARVEEKPEVRKAGGVYYTPAYIVDYIVQNTVGKLLEGKTPAEAACLKIVDPACGSGSFLLGAFQYLIDWHESWYIQNGTEKWVKGKSPALVATSGGGWKLTTGEKKKILLNNIHGVDIDAQAVEVTKLSLLLKVLEEESGQLSLGIERVLPDLGKNIQCGNSLIGEDYFEGRLVVDEDERRRVNPFDWQAAFPRVFTKGGFDAVIGNPPYGLIISEDQKYYFSNHYLTVEGRFDNFELFIEKGLIICQNDCFLSFIIPSPLLSNLYNRKLRKYLLDTCRIDEITNFGMDVFNDPTIHTCIIRIQKNNGKNKVKIRKQVRSISELETPFDYEIEQTELGRNSNYSFDIFIDPCINKIFKKLTKRSRYLGELCYIRQCIKTGDDATYVKKFIHNPSNPWKPTLRGRSINRYSTLETNEYVKYGSWLARNWKNKTFYETQKIAVRETGDSIIATLDIENRYFLSSLYAIYFQNPNEKISLRYLLGIINSNLSSFVAKKIALDLTIGAFTKFRTNQLARLPIYEINFNDKESIKNYDRIVFLVERMLTLHKQTPRTPQEKESLQREIASTDHQIDKLVYELYGLTEDEIKIVEGRGNPRGCPI
jgi:predicted type IV restriction endonuclease